MSYDESEFDPELSPYYFIGQVEGTLKAMVSNQAKINALCGLVDEFNEAKATHKERLQATQKRLEEEVSV